MKKKKKDSHLNLFVTNISIRKNSFEQLALNNRCFM